MFVTLFVFRNQPKERQAFHKQVVLHRLDPLW
jgi:hypothetical protein